jgi:hypothetical protein
LIQFLAEYRPHLLRGVAVVKGRGLYPISDQDRGMLYRPLGSIKYETAEFDLTAIPYYSWANRGSSHMVVWLPTSKG